MALRSHTYSVLRTTAFLVLPSLSESLLSPRIQVHNRARIRNQSNQKEKVMTWIKTSNYDEDKSDTNDDENDEQRRKAALANHRSLRQVKREDRIAVLQESRKDLTEFEEKELQGLLSSNFSEQYSSDDFTEAHSAFKAAHNGIFSKLCMHCQAMQEDDINVFYLDGPCAATTKALASVVNVQQQCYTANRHASTCQALRNEGLVHVAHESAKDALDQGGTFGDIQFHAFYLDGCGGYTPHVIEMMEAALRAATMTPPIAIGFSILGGGRDCVDKEQEVIRALVQIVKPMGFRVDHVGDDPALYGIDEMKKVESSTLTSWCMIVESDRIRRFLYPGQDSCSNGK